MVEKTQLLFFPVHPPSWQTMSRLAMSAKKRKQTEPVMILSEPLWHHANFCKEQQIPYILFGKSPEVFFPQTHSGHTLNKGDQKRDATTPLLKRLYQKLRLWMKNLESSPNSSLQKLSIYQFVKCLVEIPNLYRQLRVVRETMDELNPKAAFIYSDNLGGIFSYFHQLCKKKRVRLISVAAAYYDPTGPASRRKKTYLQAGSWPQYSLLNLFLHRLLPRQFFNYEGKDTLFFEPYEILSMAPFGILPPNPWYRGKNYCDSVCVEDTATKQKYSSWGIDEKNVEVTGHTECDLLYESLSTRTREEFFNSMGLNPDKKLIVIAAPQFMEHNEVASWEEHWYENEYFIRPACETQQNVLVALHPKAELARYEFLEKKYPCRIFRGPTSETVPFADIFISAGSSTCLWGVQCGAIVINIDLYDYSVKVFDYIESIKRVKTREEYPNLIRDLCEDEDFFNSNRIAAKKDQNLFPPLDGKNTERVLSLAE